MTIFKNIWCTGWHCVSCGACGTYPRHNGVLRFALAQALTGSMHYANYTEDPSSLRLGPGQHVDARLSNDFTTLGVFHGHPRETRPLCIDVGISSGGALTNVNTSDLNDACLKHLRAMEERKQSKYGDAATESGARFVPVVFSAQGAWGERWTNEPHLRWLQDEMKRVEESSDPWENEWTVHRQAREIATLIGCEIARQNGRMIERVLQYQRQHNREARHSMQAWQWGDSIDYARMSGLEHERHRMIADYRQAKLIAGHRRRRFLH